MPDKPPAEFKGIGASSSHESPIVLLATLMLVLYGSWMTYEAWMARAALGVAYGEYSYCLDLLAGATAVPVE